MRCSYSIDWTKATRPYEGTVMGFIENEQSFFDAEWTEAKGRIPPYIQGVECEFATIMWHPEHVEFGVLYQSTGQQCDAMTRAGYDPAEWIEHLQKVNAHFTRIDFAVDLFDCGGRPKDIYTAWANRKLGTPSRKVTIMQQRNEKRNTTGETVYIGSRTSSKLCRIYDKAAEQGKAGDDWIRVEIEVKSPVADAFAKSTTQIGLTRTGLSYIRSLVKYTEVDWFEAIFTGDYPVVPIQKIGRKETDFDRWFFRVVVPACDKALRTGTPGAREALRRIIESEHNRHGGNRPD